MPSIYSWPLRPESNHLLSSCRRWKATVWTILLAMVSLTFPTPSTLAQTGSYSRIAVQIASQDDLKPKVKSEVRRPLDSDARYVCTLSGFGNLAHCYPR